MPASGLRAMKDDEVRRERNSAMVEALFFWQLAERRNDGGGKVWERHNRRAEVAADRALRMDADLERRAGGGRD